MYELYDDAYIEFMNRNSLIMKKTNHIYCQTTSRFYTFGAGFARIYIILVLIFSTFFPYKKHNIILGLYIL